MEKKCAKCKQVKTLSDFHKSKQGKDGFKTECKDCRSLYSKVKRVENGGTNHVNRSKETTLLKVCTKCLNLCPRDGFGKGVWCEDCKRSYNRAYGKKRFGSKEKFIPIITKIGKQCASCKIVKNFEDFSPAKRGRKGLSSYCKPCASNIQLNLYTKEERKEKTQKYRDANRNWWRNLHRINQFNRKKRVKLSSDGSVTKDFIEKVYSLTICYYCKEETPRKFRTLEHKLPLIKGGLHSIDNITMACFVCNSTKGRMTEEEYNNYKNNKNNE